MPTVNMGTFDQGIFDRGKLRGQSIFPIFKYQIPGVMPEGAYREREVIFGVYAGAYLHGYNYLADITAEDLAQAVAKFDAAVAEMGAEEARVLVDIAAKRYIQQQEMAIRDAAIANKRLKLQNLTSSMDAKLAALDADRAAIETKRTALNVAREKVAVEIDELNTKIAEQGVDAAMTEAEVSRQQLAERKAQLDLIETGIRALEIQAAIADAAYRMQEVEVRKSGAEADVARLDLEIEEVDIKASDIRADTAQLRARKETESLVASDLEVEKAELAALQAQTNKIGPAKRALLRDKIAADKEELAAQGNILTATTTEGIAQQIAQAAQHDLRTDEYANKKGLYDNKYENLQTEVGEYTGDIYPMEKQLIQDEKTAKEATWAARINANRKRGQSKTAAAETIMNANIVSTLTHSIGAASGGGR